MEGEVDGLSEWVIEEVQNEKRSSLVKSKLSSMEIYVFLAYSYTYVRLDWIPLMLNCR